MLINQKKQHGFTIVELLIVIVVIAILAAISIVAYNGIQNRSQDSKRAQDLANIEKALKSYDTLYGGVPKTEVYGGNGGGDWNDSSMTNWLTFLERDFSKMPRDSINTLGGGTYATDLSARQYYYYCYPSSSAVEPNKPTVVIGYHKADGTKIDKIFIVQSCLLTLP